MPAAVPARVGVKTRQAQTRSLAPPCHVPSANDAHAAGAAWPAGPSAPAPQQRSTAVTYETLKWLHVAAVVLSGAGFAARGALMLAQSPLLQARFARLAPHLVDTIPLLAAVGLTALARLSPLAQPWLAAKIGALIVYILLGTVALRRGRSRRARIAAFAAALLTFGYIVGTALAHDPSWPRRLN